MHAWRISLVYVMSIYQQFPRLDSHYNHHQLSTPIQLFNMYQQDILQEFPPLLQEPQNKIQYFTGDSESHSLIPILEKDSVFERHLQFAQQIDQDFMPQDNQGVFPQPDSLHISEQQENKPKKKKTTGKNGHKKNSNVVKKMGRLILNNLDQYRMPSTDNEGVSKLVQMLKQKKIDNCKSKCLADGFNTSHLEALFNLKDKKASTFNLKTTRRIFTRLLRQQVEKSIQIKGEAKLLYLNTLKCCSLRLANRKLAVRLQASQTP